MPNTQSSPMTSRIMNATKASTTPVVRSSSSLVGVTTLRSSSTTWRTLPANRKAPGSDAEWKLLLREYPQLIRRPVVVTDDGVVTQGFTDNGFKKRFGVG